MSAAEKTKKAEELVKQTEKLLAKKQLFEAEEHAQKALIAARSARNLELMIKIAPLLGAARKGRLEQALAVGRVAILDETIQEELPETPGCYLIQPPLVGADARRLRIAALEAKTPIAVVCREPITGLRLCPIVSICPGTTVRTQIDPPDDLDEPDIEWFAGALQQLGDWALATIDPDIDAMKRVDAIVERLGAVPEHEGLHESLVDACRAALKDELDESGPAASSRRSTARSR